VIFRRGGNSIITWSLKNYWMGVWPQYLYSI
jgi:hypothetical protein